MKQGKLTHLLEKLADAESKESIAKASQGIDLLIFDQLRAKVNAFDRLPLFELLRQDQDNGFWDINLYNNEPDKDGYKWDNALEQLLIKQTGALWKDITTDDFHQKLIETGDQFFMPNNP
jgi:hypothetical protein